METNTGKQIVDNLKLTEKVIELVVTTLGQDRVKIRSSTPLLSGRKLFDSYRLMEFILRLEDNFKIRIPDEDLDPDIFETPRTIAKYLLGRLEKDV